MEADVVVGLGIVICRGVNDAHACFCDPCYRARGGEGGDEARLDGLVRGCTRVADGVDYELHLPPIFLEDRNKGGVALGLIYDVGIVAEI